MRDSTLVTVAAVSSIMTAGALIFLAYKGAMLSNKVTATLNVVQQYAPKMPQIGAKKGESAVDQVCRVGNDVCKFKKEIGTAVMLVQDIW
jgi:hypothetical protein